MPYNFPSIEPEDISAKKYRSSINSFSAEFKDRNIERAFRLSELPSQRNTVFFLIGIVVSATLLISLLIELNQFIVPWYLNLQRVATFSVLVLVGSVAWFWPTNGRIDWLTFLYGTMVVAQNILLLEVANPEHLTLFGRILSGIAISGFLFPSRFFLTMIYVAALMVSGLYMLGNFLVMETGEQIGMTSVLIFITVGCIAMRWRREITKRVQFITNQDLKGIAQRLVSSEAQMRLINDNLPIFIAYVDVDEKLVFVNKTGHAWYRNFDPSVLGQNIELFLGAAYPFVKKKIQTSLKGEEVHFSRRLTFPDGQERYVNISHFPDVDEDGKVLGYITQMVDVTALKSVEEQLRAEKQAAEQQARTDTLTGMLNRRAFFEDGERVFNLAKRHGHSLSIIMCDLDHFKSVNDSHGHATGDEVLVETAKCISSSIRSTDIAARIGGEEFVILLPETAERDAMEFAEKLRSVLENKAIETAQASITITASLGVAEYRATDVSLDNIMQHADEAAYRSKENGRNRVTAFGGEPDQ